MKHREIKYSLPDFVNNKLSGEEFEIVNEHLLTCLACKREVQELEVLMSELKKESAVIPSPQYWSSMLPRIHQRIEEKSEQRIPEWLVRYALPLSAAVVLIVGLFNVKLATDNSDLAEVQTIAKQLSSEELNQVTETVTTPGFREASLSDKDESLLVSEDKEELKEFLQNDTDLTAHTDINFEATTRKMSVQQADDFVAVLEQIYNEH